MPHEEGVRCSPLHPPRELQATERDRKEEKDRRRKGMTSSLLARLVRSILRF